MKRFVLVAGACAGLLMGAPVQAQFAVSAGLEYFSWTEDTSPIQVKETGPMFALGLEWTQRKEHGLLGAYRGRFYVGDVDYTGVKYPFWIEEDANFTDEGYDQNPSLEPGGEPSLYGQIGYRFRRNLAVVGYVDGFRFSQSSPVTVTQAGNMFQFYQPQSTMLVVGVKLQYLF